MDNTTIQNHQSSMNQTNLSKFDFDKHFNDQLKSSNEKLELRRSETHPLVKLKDKSDELT